MERLTKPEIVFISGGTDLPTGACYAPGHEPKTMADHAEDGYNVGSYIGRTLDYLASAFDKAFNRAKW